mmetsp:Transcript_4171/g.11669  ORF Transcript_4171/g.11669 Transcript_4171/m.11669 type:complete len:242 (+) Transcript_4171:106-831(+)
MAARLVLTPPSPRSLHLPCDSVLQPCPGGLLCAGDEQCPLETVVRAVKMAFTDPVLAKAEEERTRAELEAARLVTAKSVLHRCDLVLRERVKVHARAVDGAKAKQTFCCSAAKFKGGLLNALRAVLKRGKQSSSSGALPPHAPAAHRRDRALEQHLSEARPSRTPGKVTERSLSEHGRVGHGEDERGNAPDCTCAVRVTRDWGEDTMVQTMLSCPVPLDRAVCCAIRLWELWLSDFQNVKE